MARALAAFAVKPAIVCRVPIAVVARFVVRVLNGEIEATRVNADWHGWLHHSWDETPEARPLAHKTWEKPHQENLTGTALAYAPAGSIRREKPADRGDYEAWQPE